MSNKEQQSVRPPMPAEYPGQWVAWDHDRTRIIANGPTWEETWQKAIATGEGQPYLERALDDEGYIGSVA